jgi:hypothetical protein
MYIVRTIGLPDKVSFRAAVEFCPGNAVFIFQCVIMEAMLCAGRPIVGVDAIDALCVSNDMHPRFLGHHQNRNTRIHVQQHQIKALLMECLHQVSDARSTEQLLNLLILVRAVCCVRFLWNWFYA